MNSIARKPLFALLMFIAFTALSATTNAQSPTPGNGRDEVDAALDRAIEFLVKSQRADGAISEGSHDTAMTSLAIMSLASMGVTPSQQDAKGEVMRKAIDFVLQDSKQDAKGYFGVADGSRMYGHGITTLMLTEIMGMGANEEQDQKIRAKCQKGIELILNAQQHPKQPSHRGGWRYTPDAGDSDLSVSVWQVMALRSAANDGLDVPESAIEDAVRYLRRSCTSPQDANGVPLQADAGFAYTPGSNSILYSMTAAGLLAMQVCGQYESKLVDRSRRLVDEESTQGRCQLLLLWHLLLRSRDASAGWRILHHGGQSRQRHPVADANTGRFLEWSWKRRWGMEKSMLPAWPS